MLGAELTHDETRLQIRRQPPPMNRLNEGLFDDAPSQ